MEGTRYRAKNSLGLLKVMLIFTIYLLLIDKVSSPPAKLLMEVLKLFLLCIWYFK